MGNVRVSAKAVIIKDDKLLVMKHDAEEEEYSILPGGGQRNGEDLSSTVKRECLEEAGVRVEVGDVLFIRDYIEDNHEFAGRKPGFHQVEIMFRCEILDDKEIGNGVSMDKWQVGIEWLPLDNLVQSSLYPSILNAMRASSRVGKIYLGDVN